jgi:tetratricopeptide (TPR) repeat protein
MAEPVPHAPPPLASDLSPAIGATAAGNGTAGDDTAAAHHEPGRATDVESLPAPVSRRGRLRGLAIGGIALAVVAGVTLPASVLLRAPRTTIQEAMDAESRRNAVALGARLPARWRADTALLNRYLRAESHMQFDRLVQARGEFRELTTDAPLYAPGWAGLSHALSLSGFLDMPPRDASTLARATALRALALDSTIVQPRYALIAYDMFAAWDLPAARARLDSALAQNPDDAELSNLLAAWERWTGRLDEAVALKQKVLAMQPTSVFYADQLGYSLYLAHRCADAAERFRRLAVDFDYASIVYARLYRSLRCLGRDSDAIDALQQALRQSGDSTNVALIGRAGSPAAREEARRAVFRAQLDRQLHARQHTWMQASAIAESYAELGDTEGTLAWLDSMYVERSWVLHDVPFDPRYDFLRGDERFQRLIHTLPWQPSRGFAGDGPRRVGP